MPNFRKIPASTSVRITVECTSHPLKSGSISMAALAFSRFTMRILQRITAILKMGFVPLLMGQAGTLVKLPFGPIC